MEDSLSEKNSESMLRFLADMREVDEAMANGGRRYDEDALKEALGLN